MLPYIVPEADKIKAAKDLIQEIKSSQHTFDLKYPHNRTSQQFSINLKECQQKKTHHHNKSKIR